MTLEEKIIGAILIDDNAYEKVCDILQLKHFKNPNMRRIYMSMHILKHRKGLIDVHRVAGLLSETGSLMGVGGLGYIAKLASEVSSSKDVEEWARCLVLDWEEQEELRRKYAGIELPRLDPQGDWVTVEEMRTILHKENEEFYKKLKCNGKKECMPEVGFNKSKWMPLEEAKKQVIDDIQKNMTEFIVSS